MEYLSGSRHKDHAELYASGTLGFLQTPRASYSLEGVARWAMDNGCYSPRGYPGDEAFLALLERHRPHQSQCLFVCAPDVVGDAEATLARSAPMLGRIRALGYPVALVGQDGMEALPIPWDAIDWVFIGGSTEWKLGPGARVLVARAKSYGKRIHVGRVNSAKRFRYAAHTLKADSVDGTFLAFGPARRLPEVLAWLRGNDQMTLDLEE